MEPDKLRRQRKFSAKHRGLITVITFLPVLTAAILSAAFCLTVAAKFSESLSIQTETLAADNIAVQVQNVLFDSLKIKLSNGEILPDFSVSAAALGNPAIKADDKIIDKISSANSHTEIKAYIVDENYSLSWMPEAQKLGIPKRAPEMYGGEAGNEYFSKRYALVSEIKPKNALNKSRCVYITEAAVYLCGGKLSVKKLHTQRRQIMTE